MSHNMPMLADERRRWLIDECTADMQRYTSASPRYLVAQIALAALTTEPIHEACYRTYYPDTEDESHRAHSESGELCARRIAGELGGYVEKVLHIADGENAYTAPPVPALKLPGRFAGEASSDSQMAWNACIDEFKRLNGVAE